jgi:outer membrane protein assembly factor BamB
LLAAPADALGADWRRFGYDSARTNAPPGATGITRANAGTLVPQRIELPGTVDNSPAYLADVSVAGVVRDVFIVTTTYGRTIAVDASTGAQLWSFVPAGIADWEGHDPYVSSSPVVDRERQFVYAPAPDGKVHKLSVADGSEVLAGWPVTVSVLPEREKLSSALNITDRYVFATTASFRDREPYQGHLVVIDRRSGRVVNVFNANCTRRKVIVHPNTCGHTLSGIWGRGDPVVHPGGERLVVGTGNGPLNNRTRFGGSILHLSPDARRVLGVWNPPDYKQRAKVDADLGSGSAVLVRGNRYAITASKDGAVRMVDLKRMRRTGRPGRVPGLVQTVGVTPRIPFVSAPTYNRATRTVYLANGVATVAYDVRGRHRPRLVRRWRRNISGTTPILAGGLLFVYDFQGSRLQIYDPATGRTIASHAAEGGHWASPIVADGRVALGSGDARKYMTTGSLFVYRLP